MGVGRKGGTMRRASWRKGAESLREKDMWTDGEGCFRRKEMCKQRLGRRKQVCVW